MPGEQGQGREENTESEQRFVKLKMGRSNTSAGKVKRRNVPKDLRGESRVG